jgi:hypothetical protein
MARASKQADPVVLGRAGGGNGTNRRRHNGTAAGKMARRSFSMVRRCKIGYITAPCDVHLDHLAQNLHRYLFFFASPLEQHFSGKCDVKKSVFTWPSPL